MSWINCLRFRKGKPRKKRRTPIAMPRIPHSTGERSRAKGSGDVPNVTKYIAGGDFADQVHLVRLIPLGKAKSKAAGEGARPITYSPGVEES